jgi:hypothetical protein
MGGQVERPGRGSVPHDGCRHGDGAGGRRRQGRTDTHECQQASGGAGESQRAEAENTRGNANAVARLQEEELRADGGAGASPWGTLAGKVSAEEGTGEEPLQQRGHGQTSGDVAGNRVRAAQSVKPVGSYPRLSFLSRSALIFLATFAGSDAGFLPGEFLRG